MIREVKIFEPLTLPGVQGLNPILKNQRSTQAFSKKFEISPSLTSKTIRDIIKMSCLYGQRAFAEKTVKERVSVDT